MPASHIRDIIYLVISVILILDLVLKGYIKKRKNMEISVYCCLDKMKSFKIIALLTLAVGFVLSIWLQDSIMLLSAVIVTKFVDKVLFLCGLGKNR